MKEGMERSGGKTSEEKRISAAHGRRKMIKKDAKTLKYIQDRIHQQNERETDVYSLMTSAIRGPSSPPWCVYSPPRVEDTAPALTSKSQGRSVVASSPQLVPRGEAQLSFASVAALATPLVLRCRCQCVRACLCRTPVFFFFFFF